MKFKVTNLLLSLRDRISTLQNETLALRKSDFPDSIPSSIIDVLSTILNCLSKLISTELDIEPNNSGLLKSYDQLISHYLILSESIHEAIDVLSTGIKKNVPWAITRVTNEILQISNFRDINVVYAPMWELNFSIFPNRLQDILTNSRPVLERSPEGKTLLTTWPHIVSIHYSYIDRKKPLVYPVFGHEIGHLFSEEYLRDNDIDPAWISTKLEPAIASLSPTEAAIYRQTFLEARWRAVEELGADLFGLHVLGPAFIFALFDLLSRHALDLTPSQDTLYYPSNRYRFKTALQNLDRFESSTEKEAKVLIEAIQKIEDITSQNSCAEETALTPIKLAYQHFIECDHPKIIWSLNSKYKNAKFDIETFLTYAGKLTERLLAGIPPNKADGEKRLIKPIEVLNVGWLAEAKALLNYRWDASPGKYLSEIQERDRLVLKAIDLCEMERFYTRT